MKAKVEGVLQETWHCKNFATDNEESLTSYVPTSHAIFVFCVLVHIQGVNEGFVLFTVYHRVWGTSKRDWQGQWYKNVPLKQKYDQNQWPGWNGTFLYGQWLKSNDFCPLSILDGCTRRGQARQRRSLNTTTRIVVWWDLWNCNNWKIWISNWRKLSVTKVWPLRGLHDAYKCAMIVAKVNIVDFVKLARQFDWSYHVSQAIANERFLIKAVKRIRWSILWWISWNMIQKTNVASKMTKVNVIDMKYSNLKIEWYTINILSLIKAICIHPSTMGDKISMTYKIMLADL